MTSRRAFVVRLDAETLHALDAAAAASGLSREGYVRKLIVAQLAPRSHRHAIRAQRARTGADGRSTEPHPNK